MKEVEKSQSRRKGIRGYEIKREQRKCVSG
jgi:hypothetical protein